VVGNLVCELFVRGTAHRPGGTGDGPG